MLQLNYIPKRERGFLNNLEAYLAKRDGVDKILKISRYATKVRELKRINEDEACLDTSTQITVSRGVGCKEEEEEEERKRKLREKKLMKQLSVVQHLADALMALAGIQDGKGGFSDPLLYLVLEFYRLFSSHKN
ncbi:hypothetical protein DITRI_Ditri03aG0202500 [Diplodiscus trichospermus]